MVKVWRAELTKVNPKAAESIADPLDYPNLFEGLHHALKAEEWLKAHPLHEAPASVYSEHANDNESDLIEYMKTLDAQPEPQLEPTGEVAYESPLAQEESPWPEEDPEPQPEEVVAEPTPEPEPEPEPEPPAAAVGSPAVPALSEEKLLEQELEASLNAPEVDLDDDLDAELEAELNQ